jgi:hypothetical protein
LASAGGDGNAEVATEGAETAKIAKRWRAGNKTPVMARGYSLCLCKSSATSLALRCRTIPALSQADGIAATSVYFAGFVSISAS